jgi:hypothetical protein
MSVDGAQANANAVSNLQVHGWSARGAPRFTFTLRSGADCASTTTTPAEKLTLESKTRRQGAAVPFWISMMGFRPALKPTTWPKIETCNERVTQKATREVHA